jgi:hypothetical protein
MFSITLVLAASAEFNPEGRRKSNMETSPDSTGDLGEFIISELNKRGVALSMSADLPRLSATWRKVTAEFVSTPKYLGVRVQGGSLADVSAFCFAVFSRFRVHRPRSNDNDRNFFFSAAGGGSGHFDNTGTGLVISFVTLGVALTIGESGQELHIGFAEHPLNPEARHKR